MTIMIKVPKEELLDEYVLDDAIEDNITDTSRWSEHHRAIIPWKGKFYEVYYSCGATECQDESPWEYEDEVELIEVEKRYISVPQWIVV